MVFIQGCAGAYSEAAAKKAYPNCEAVPCEHFDTAFQVAKGIACSAHPSYFTRLML
jgi:prephenate dehydratase